MEEGNSFGPDRDKHLCPNLSSLRQRRKRETMTTRTVCARDSKKATQRQKKKIDEVDQGKEIREGIILT